MRKSPDATTIEEAGPVLQLKRELLLIDEYAKQEGVSESVIEECVNLGVIQTRKYKNKTFVVDVPSSPYHYDEGTDEMAEDTDAAAHAKMISEMVQKVSGQTDQDAERSEPTDNDGEQRESSSGLLQSSAIETMEKFDLVPLVKENKAQFDMLVEQAKSKRNWHMATLFVMALFFVALCGFLWVYADRATQLDRLYKAYGSVQTIYDSFRQVRRQVSSVQNELDSSQAESESLRTELAKVKDELVTAHNRNAVETQWRNEQIREITKSLEK